jgi:predicted Zn finger-like uncharacterized protein
MDVRCDRCQTEYELDESRLTDAGVAVKCTNCGNVFKVKRVSVPPGVAAPHPLGESHAPAAPVLGAHAPRVWNVQRYDGSTLTLNDLTELQRAVVERQVAPDDGVSISGGAWHTLGSIPELASFFEVVRTSGRTTSGSFAAAVGAGPGARATTGTMAAAQNRTLTPVWEEGPSTLGSVAAHSGDPAWTSVRPVAPDPEIVAMLEREDSQFLRKSRMGRSIGLAVVLLLLLGGGVAFYVLGLPGMGAPGTLSVPPIKPPDVNAPVRPPPEHPGAGTEAAAPALPAAPPIAPRAEPKPAAGVPSKTEPAKTELPSPKKSAAAPEAAEAAGPAGRGFDYDIAQGHKLLDSKPAAALALFEKAATLDPNSPEPDSGRGLAYSNMERLTDAATAFGAALRKSSEFTEAILGLAEVSAQQGNRRKAIGLYQRYLDLTPDGPDAPAARAQMDELKAEAPAQPAPTQPAPERAAAAQPAAAVVPPTPSAPPKQDDAPPPPPVVVPDTAPPAR